MFRLHTEVTISAAHHLRFPYSGQCAEMHGHNWRVELWFENEATDPRGFAGGVDFAEVKRRVKSRFDHKLLNNVPPFVTQKADMPVVNPTAENLCVEIHKMLADLGCTQVRVWESEKSWAEWTPPKETPNESP